MKKKILSFLLAFVFILSTSSLAFAATNIKVDNDNVQCKILTKEQFIQRLSEVEDITIQEATEIVELNELGTKGAEGVIEPLSYTYTEWYTQKNVGAGYKVEVGALVKMATGGGYSQFDTVMSTWSEAIGSGSYTWESFYKEAQILNAGQLLLSSRGNIVVAVDRSTSAGIKLGNDLIAAGFEISHEISKTTYYRQTVSVRETITLSWWR